MTQPAEQPERADPDQPGGDGVRPAEPPVSSQRDKPTGESVAFVLAIGISVALNIVTIALLWAATQRLGIDPDSGISDNGVQLLLAWGGGIISILAAYVGYAFGRRRPPHD